MRREGAAKGNRKVRDKRLENGIGQPHACHDFSRVGRYVEGGAWCGGGGGLADTGSLVLLHIVPGE